MRGAWWPGPEYPAPAVKAFSHFVATFGNRVKTPRGETVFCTRARGAIPPQPTGRAENVDLHALRQADDSGETVGWAWCFGINVGKHRAYLQNMETKR